MTIGIADTAFTEKYVSQLKETLDEAFPNEFESILIRSHSKTDESEAEIPYAMDAPLGAGLRFTLANRGLVANKWLEETQSALANDEREAYELSQAISISTLNIDLFPLGVAVINLTFSNLEVLEPRALTKLIEAIELVGYGDTPNLKATNKLFAEIRSKIVSVKTETRSNHSKRISVNNSSLTNRHAGHSHDHFEFPGFVSIVVVSQPETQLWNVLTSEKILIDPASAEVIADSHDTYVYAWSSVLVNETSCDFASSGKQITHVVNTAEAAHCIMKSFSLLLTSVLRERFQRLWVNGSSSVSKADVRSLRLLADAMMSMTQTNQTTNAGSFLQIIAAFENRSGMQDRRKHFRESLGALTTLEQELADEDDYRRDRSIYAIGLFLSFLSFGGVIISLFQFFREINIIQTGGREVMFYISSNEAALIIMSIFMILSLVGVSILLSYARFRWSETKVKQIGGRP